MIVVHADQRNNQLNRAGGFNHCNGIVILDWQDSLASLKVDLTHDHLNPLGLVHGGLYASMQGAFTGLFPMQMKGRCRFCECGLIAP